MAEKRTPLNADENAEKRLEALRSLLESEGWDKFVAPFIESEKRKATRGLRNHELSATFHAHANGILDALEGLENHLKVLRDRAEAAVKSPGSE